MGLIATLLVSVVVQIGIAYGLRAWARWVGRRHASPWWGRMAWLPMLALLLMLAGTVISTVFLTRAMEAITSAPAASRATALAEGISNAMNTTAFFSLPAWGLFALSVVVSLVGTVRAKTARQETTLGDSEVGGER